MTGYAAGVATGGPPLALAARRLPPRTTLIGLMAHFCIGRLVTAAPNFALLLIVRLITASAHGAFFGAGMPAGGMT
jgi:DHA1 family inner membrane transport protein